MNIVEERYTFHSATEDDLDELIEFCQDNINPDWQFCAGAPPYPQKESMQKNIEIGNPFVIIKKNDEIVGYHILNRSNGQPLWGLAAVSLQGEELKEAYAQLLAHLWQSLGRVADTLVPEASDENVADELNAAKDRALEVYEELHNAV